MKRSKYGMTAATRVCCSMISEIQTRYGVTRSRHGSTRATVGYHARSGCLTDAITSVFGTSIFAFCVMNERIPFTQVLRDI